MTLYQIHKEADERYQIKKGCCRLERMDIRRLKKIFIEKKMVEFGLTSPDKSVNLKDENLLKM